MGQLRLDRHHLEVTRTARVWSLGPPPDLRDSADLWIVCHGYRQLAEHFIRRFAVLDDGIRRVVAPEGLSRFYLDEDGGPHGPESRVGATWMTREDREVEIADYVRYLDAVTRTWTASPEIRSGGGRVVLGFSQGCHTVARWIALGRTRVDRLVLWGAYLPLDPKPESYAHTLSDVDVVVVRGAKDQYASHERHAREMTRIRDAGIEARELEHAGGHALDDRVLLALAEVKTRR